MVLKNVERVECKHIIDRKRQEKFPTQPFVNKYVKVNVES
jgi:hypothetical protein